ncbi:MAG: tRNA (adenosine(37)-N6)-threonylcarbamoyltransferase complex transferase subunit TsaD [Candidatus Omnitrophica bacterium]|nr:tRNA (adenosine(37)-N6)-threonylcarbamoyltransferase complex transferase subunit TsaD [Candidatus Omnitrophota bacterium]
MIVLGIETSCDETAAAVLKNGKEVLSSCVSSSIHMHRKFGGIVPEIASRFHLEYITPVTKKALKKAGIALSDIDLICVTHTPGLMGSLLVGVSFAKALSFGLNKPVLGINHVKAHLFAPFLEKGRFKFPFIGLVASGGHSNIALVRDFDKIKMIGKTRDDAAGEAYDKVAKILGIPYPGGQVIDNLAQSISESPYRFKCAQFKDSFDFSFSGIKTNVLYTWQKVKKKNNQARAQIAYAFQREVIESLIKQSIAACKKFKIKTLSAGGGVACNSYLRKRLKEEGKKEKIKVMIAAPHLCLDNAAMIAALGAHLYKKGKRSDYNLTATSTL